MCALIPVISGEQVNVEQFIGRIECVRKLHNVSEEIIEIMLVNKLSGEAYCAFIRNWTALQEQLLDMFKAREDRLAW